MARRMRPAPERDPWADAPVGELHDPLLPRWFVLLAIAMVPIALVVFGLAFVLPGGGEVPVAERRPPPPTDASLTHEVGEIVVGDTDPAPYDAPCEHLQGVAVAGTEADQALLRNAVAGLCNVELDEHATGALAAFVDDGGVVRFAVFEATGVDSVAALDEPLILLNARFAHAGRPRWIAPALAHDAIMRAGDPATAETALRARQVEHHVCRRLLGTEQPSRGCEDAAELLSLDDPLGALRDAGYR